MLFDLFPVSYLFTYSARIADMQRHPALPKGRVSAVTGEVCKFRPPYQRHSAIVAKPCIEVWLRRPELTPSPHHRP